MDFMSLLEKEQTKETENGAIGYVTTGHKLVDLNFSIPSLRDRLDNTLFDLALKQDTELTLRWLLYLRDIRQGVGERKSFRNLVVHLCNNYEDLGKRFIEIVPIEEYGRWDDYIDIYFRIDNQSVKDVIISKLKSQLMLDMQNQAIGKPISLVTKWLPSTNTSSWVSKQRAKKLVKLLGFDNERSYRKTLSSLRKYIDVVECKMSKNEWDSINYATVPSKANLLYAQAFLNHDIERRVKYLSALKKGQTKINADALFLHDIVYKYRRDHRREDIALESMWKAQKKVDGFSNTLVVRDGSWSMQCPICGSQALAQDVADAITIYCTENNQGFYKDKFITFSAVAKMVDLSCEKTLLDKISRLQKENDCSNTNIKNVFDLVLKTAIKNNLKQEDMPKQILIISDQEFDYATYDNPCDLALFEGISRQYKENGYKLPKLIFWNVNSRINTIPLTENESGVILLSGFSKNLMHMVMSSELDPYKALVSVLADPRYSIIESVLS